MNYIDKLAKRIHEIADSDPRIIEWWKHDGSSPELLRAYALLARSKGSSTTLEDIHDAWSSVTATSSPAHQYLVPMNEVPSEVQDYDRPYLDAVHAAAGELK
jgi:hypothetical protein